MKSGNRFIPRLDRLAPLSEGQLRLMDVFSQERYGSRTQFPLNCEEVDELMMKLFGHTTLCLLTDAQCQEATKEYRKLCPLKKGSPRERDLKRRKRSKSRVRKGLRV